MAGATSNVGDPRLALARAWPTARRSSGRDGPRGRPRPTSSAGPDCATWSTAGSPPSRSNRRPTAEPPIPSPHVAPKALPCPRRTGSSTSSPLAPPVRGETTVFDPALYADVTGRLGQAEGYLQDTSAAVVSCYRRAEDWARRADPWAALGELIARIEAEFPGRLLIGPDDFARWLDDPDGLCWAVIGVEGFDALVRSPADLDRLPGLFERGVRLFQPVYTATSLLGGSCDAGRRPGPDRPGPRVPRRPGRIWPPAPGPRPLLDLAHLNPAAASDVLDGSRPTPSRRGGSSRSTATGPRPRRLRTPPRAITPENLGRLRALGGVVGFSVGPPFFESADQVQGGDRGAAATPFQGRPGFEGIAIGTDFLGVNRPCRASATPTRSIAAGVRPNVDRPWRRAGVLLGTARRPDRPGVGPARGLLEGPERHLPIGRAGAVRTADGSSIADQMPSRCGRWVRHFVGRTPMAAIGPDSSATATGLSCADYDTWSVTGRLQPGQAPLLAAMMGAVRPSRIGS